MSSRSVFFVTLIIVLLAAIVSCAQEVGDEVLTTTDVQLRTKDRIVESLSENSVLQVEKVQGKWLWVSATSGKKGWVLKNEVALRPPQSPDEKDGRASKQSSTPSGQGTAFVVHPDGYLLTNAHVVLLDDREKGLKWEQSVLTVRLGNKSYDATIVEISKDRDLALIKIEAKGLPFLILGDSDTVKLGEDMRAMGFPLSNVLGKTLKVTRGSVSGIETKKEGGLIQTDTPINPGNSGGPLLRENGEVIGVVTSVLSASKLKSELGVELATTYGFCEPINEAKKLLEAASVELPKDGTKETLSGVELVRRSAPAIGLVSARAVKWTLDIGKERLIGFVGDQRLIATLAHESVKQSVQAGSSDVKFFYHPISFRSVRSGRSTKLQLQIPYTTLERFRQNETLPLSRDKCSISPDGKRMALVVNGGKVGDEVAILELPSLKQIGTLDYSWRYLAFGTSHRLEGGVTGVSFSPDGTMIATAVSMHYWNYSRRKDSCVNWYSVKTLKRVGHFEWDKEWEGDRTVSISPNNRYLVAASYFPDSYLRVVDLVTGEKADGYKQSAKRYDWSPDSHFLSVDFASGSYLLEVSKKQVRLQINSLCG